MNFITVVCLVAFFGFSQAVDCGPKDKQKTLPGNTFYKYDMWMNLGGTEEAFAEDALYESGSNITMVPGSCFVVRTRNHELGDMIRTCVTTTGAEKIRFVAKERLRAPTKRGVAKFDEPTSDEQTCFNRFKEVIPNINVVRVCFPFFAISGNITLSNVYTSMCV